MAWTRGIGRVEIWGRLEWPRRPYRRSFATHYVHIPPGLNITWPRSLKAQLRAQGVEVRNWQEARAFLGICPHSGESFRVCKASDLCDCFDYPEHEHYRTEG